MTSTTTNDNILDNVALVHLDFDIWSGECALKEDDIELGVGGELPSKQLASLGRKKLVDPISLRPFGRLKTEARRIVESAGMSFMGGFAVPLDRIDFISSELSRIASEFEDEKQRFLNEYNELVRLWSIAHPQYSDRIQAAAPTYSQVSARFGFEHAVFKLDPANDVERHKLNNKAKTLVDKLMDEIMETSQQIFVKKLSGCADVSLRALNPMLRLEQKVEGLAFMDKRFDGIAKLLAYLSDQIRCYPEKQMSGPAFYEVMGIVCLLADGSKLRQHIRSLDHAKSLANQMAPQTPSSKASASFDIGSDIVPFPQTEVTITEPVKAPAQVGFF